MQRKPSQVKHQHINNMPAKSTITKPAAQSKTIPKPGPAADEQAETTQATAGGTSRADLFNDAAAAGGFSFKPGQYIVLLTGVSLLTDGEKMSVQFDFECTGDNDPEDEGKTLRSWYNFFDEEGTPMQGMGFFKRDVAVLGKDAAEFIDAFRNSEAASDPDWTEFKEVLAELGDERLECIVDVKEKKGFTNVYLKGLRA